MSKLLADPFVIDWPLLAPSPEAAASQTLLDPKFARLPLPQPQRSTVGFWSYDRLNQDEADRAAGGLGITLRTCERPEELVGCGLVILDLDFLYPWGDADSTFQAALAATGGTRSLIVGVTYNDEHRLACCVPLFRSALEVLIRVATGSLP